MRIRESGMPPQQVWDEFFDTGEILRQLRLNSERKNVVEFGCGYGTFTLPAARLASGQVFTMDLDPGVLGAAKKNAAAAGLQNISFELRDFVADGSGLKDQSVDYAMLFNILHVDDPVALLRGAHRNLAAGGLLGIIHWLHAPESPRGPPLDIRPKAEQCESWAPEAGFTTLREAVNLPPWHYGILLQR
jgi:SAM-dependent methyltransferase